MKLPFLPALAAGALGLLSAQGISQARDNVQVRDLRDGFVRVITPSYSFEVPKGWEVGAETSFGQRTMMPPAGSPGQMTAMTAPGAGRQSWEQLYRTAVYFATRETRGKATPFTISKTGQGYEACSFSVLDDQGFAKARYVMLRNPAGTLLALSVKVPDKRSEAELERIFQRLVKSTRIE